MEFVRYIVIFILLYNFWSVVSAFANLFIESMNWIIGVITIDLDKRQNEAELEISKKEELEHRIGFQVDSPKDEF